MRLLLLKSMKFANQAGYYLLNGRWHSIKQDKPAPKGAPIAAHPEAAGKHSPAKHFTDEEWAKLKLPETNVNAPSYNKHLDKLKEMSEAGHVTGILGMQYGTNTYGKKAAIVANHLLGLHGSAHQVAAGQKAGEHPAVKNAPKAEEPAAAEQKPEVKPEPKSEAKSEAKPAEQQSDLAVPEFAEGKQAKGVKAHYEKTANKIIAAAKAGDLSALQFMPKDTGNTWKGKTENSKKLMALHEQAIAYAQANKPQGKDIQHPDAEKQAKQEAKDIEKEQGSTEPTQANAAPKLTPKGLLIGETGHAKTYANKTQAQKAADKLTAQGHSAHVVGTHPFFVKVDQDKPAAESKKDEALNAAIDHLKEDAKQGDLPKDEQKEDQALVSKLDAAVEQPTEGEKPVDAHNSPNVSDKTASASPVSDKLSQIPWDKLKIPDSNSNAKQHNSTIDKIKEMAEAGDVAGLQAMYDKKAGSKQTYIKKQALLAQTALAALEDVKDAAPEQAKDELFAGMKKPPEFKGGSDFTEWVWSSDAVELYKDGVKKYGSEEAWDASPEMAYINALSEKYKEFKAPAPATGGKPVKPQIKIYDAVADNIESALNSGNKPQLESLVQMTSGLKGVDANGTKVHEYAVDALSYLQDQEGQSSNQAGTDTENDGPQEGETKQGANGTLVFQNGRWHKQGDDKSAEKPAPAGPAEVEIPEFNGPNATHNAWLKKAAEALKEKVVAEGKEGLKQPLTNHKNGTVTVKIAGVHVGKASVTSANPALASFAQFVDELKSSVSKKPKKAKAAPKAAVAPQSAGGIETMDHWTQTGGQGGSNPGGKFKDEHGTEWYCKFPESEDVAKSEVLAAKLYAAAGIAGQDAKIVTKGGRLGIASKWQTVNKASPKDLSEAPGVLSGFAVDAWLANWDVVGLGYDNLQLNEAGHAVRVDAGGSLMYRAQGGKKAFGDHVTELDSLRDAAINPQAASVFSKMTEADITASVAKVLRISDAKIAKLVNEFGPGSEQEKQALIKTLIARKQNLAEKFPKAQKAENKPKFDPAKISAPPDFMNWGGPGLPGPSSKKFLNEANHAAAQHIFEAAKTGDINAVQSLQEPVYNKTNGEVTSQAPVLEHTSQHIKGYAKQVINEIDYQMNPPKKFRLGGDHPLNALNASYPVAKGKVVDAKKLGEFIVLGEPGTIDIDSLGMPKITYAAGKLTKQTYVKQAHAAVEKMPQTQLQAVQAYTGSSYKSMNSSLWAGNPSGQAKAAAEALHTLAHDVVPGTVLSRKISLPSSDVEKLTKSVGKVLQEPAIMSTSIRPSSWSGNVHLKLHVGPGVKGLWVGPGSMPGGGALSYNSGEDEMVLPPNTRLLILSSKAGGSTDSDGFGSSSKHIIEALILPSEGY